MQSAKEAAANIAASAQSGLDKTKAVVQEKVDKMTAPNPIEKQLATERKQQKIQDAELTKQATYQQNAAMAHAAPHAPHAVGGPGPYSYTTTTTGATSGGNQMSALPGHGTGQPLAEGTTQSHPTGTTMGTEGLPQTHPNAHPIGTVTGTGVTAQSHPNAHPIGTATGTGGTAQSHPNAHPIGTATGTEMPITGHNTNVGGGYRG